MRMYDIIEKKKNALHLTEREIRYAVDGFTASVIPDYQMSALLMAICINGLSDEETVFLTSAMADSGEKADLSKISGIKTDKHSTGGVGDKTTLIAAPVAAALGCYVAKMSGRGLGHTGGTIDKLESIPGLKTGISREEFIDIVNKIGLCITGQSGNLAPADKRMYALRDVTATVDSIPLIAASIMSKKLASGADAIVLDVKCGGGAFVKTPEKAEELARIMISSAKSAGKKAVALITDMDTPLGCAIGNALEFKEAVETLNGRGPADLTDISIELAAHMLHLSGAGNLSCLRDSARECLASGKALIRLAEMVSALGGDSRYIYDPSLFGEAPVIHEIPSPACGYISHMDTACIGRCAMLLGAGRETAASVIDHRAGILLRKKTGDYVTQGEIICTLHTSSPDKLPEAKERFLNALTFSGAPLSKKELIIKTVY